MGLRELLIPREKIFFQLLEEESKNVLAGAVAFNELIQNFDHLALFLYEVDSPTETMRRLADLVLKSVREIDFAFASIQKIKASEIEARCTEVDTLENEADVVLNESVAALFKTTDAIAIIKFKEIYELMETITDKCEDVVQVIRDIILEYS